MIKPQDLKPGMMFVHHRMDCEEHIFILREEVKKTSEPTIKSFKCICFFYRTKEQKEAFGFNISYIEEYIGKEWFDNNFEFLEVLK